MKKNGDDVVANDAGKIASGGSITFAGILVDRGLRYGTNWFLARTLGPAAYGVYAFTTKALCQLIAAFAVIGLDTGIVFFGARYRKSGERDRLKRTLIAGSVIAIMGGLLSAVGLLTVSDRLWTDQPAVAAAARWGALIVVLWAPLLFIVGTLRSFKDMRSSALAYQVTLPTILLGGILLSSLLGGDVTGALIAYSVALFGSLVVGARLVWRHVGPLIRDQNILPRFEIKTLLAFSLPQSLAGMVFRLNTRMDFWMLMWLASESDVGLYDVAAALAMLGALPVNALMTMFNPIVSELVYARELERLNQLLKIVTRWLVILAIPAYLLLLLLPDVVLSVYTPEYAASRLPLMILIGGQVVNVACAPTMRLIPMSGHATLNLINGLVAASINITLNWFWIPEWGIIGAAMATSVTIAAWALWRVIEVWWLLKCFPFTLRTGGLLLVAGICTLTVHLTTADASIPIRILGTSLALVGHGLAVWIFGRTPADDAVVGKFKRRIQRLFRRG